MEQKSIPTAIVSTFNEWDLLEEIVVGASTRIPCPAVGRHHARRGPRQDAVGLLQAVGRHAWPVEMLKKAERDLEAFIDAWTGRRHGATARAVPLRAAAGHPDWEAAAAAMR